jgi:hypothetical protein
MFVRLRELLREYLFSIVFRSESRGRSSVMKPEVLDLDLTLDVVAVEVTPNRDGPVFELKHRRRNATENLTMLGSEFENTI